MAGIDAYTKLKLHLDNNVTDSELTPKTVTNNNVTFSDIIKKFGTHAGYFNGTNSELTISPGFVPGSGDYTVDLWVYTTAFPTQNRVICSNYPGGVSTFMLFFATNTIYFYSGLNAVASSNILVLNTWYHIACVRYNEIITLYVNGISKGSTSSSDNITIPIIYIGAAEETYYFPGYLDEIRFSSKACWTSEFTPPTIAYSRDSKPRSYATIII